MPNSKIGPFSKHQRRCVYEDVEGARGSEHQAWGRLCFYFSFLCYARRASISFTYLLLSLFDICILCILFMYFILSELFLFLMCFRGRRGFLRFIYNMSCYLCSLSYLFYVFGCSWNFLGDRFSIEVAVSESSANLDGLLQGFTGQLVVLDPVVSNLLSPWSLFTENQVPHMTKWRISLAPATMYR